MDLQVRPWWYETTVRPFPWDFTLHGFYRKQEIDSETLLPTDVDVHCTLLFCIVRVYE